VPIAEIRRSKSDQLDAIRLRPSKEVATARFSVAPFAPVE
jgi:hypothetical protein